MKFLQRVDWFDVRQRLLSGLILAVMEIGFCLWILAVYYFLFGKRG